jgi:hypothetical protein
MIEDLEIHIIEEDDGTLYAFNSDFVEHWEPDDYRDLFKKCAMQQKIELYNKEDGKERVIFMPPEG